MVLFNWYCLTQLGSEPMKHHGCSYISTSPPSNTSTLMKHQLNVSCSHYYQRACAHMGTHKSFCESFIQDKIFVHLVNLQGDSVPCDLAPALLPVFQLMSAKGKKTTITPHLLSFPAACASASSKRATSRLWK